MNNNEQTNRINYTIRHYDNMCDIDNMLNAILELGLVEWVRNFNYIGGFAKNGGENYLLICNHRFVQRAHHYGSSCAESLRACQIILLTN
jgi:hypothetical protein